MAGSASVKQVGGIWLPDHETHMVEWMNNSRNRHYVDGNLTYQWKKQVAAMNWVRSFGVAVDVGAHVGLWSMHLVKRFREVHSFEPVLEHRECFQMNVPEKEVISFLYPVALGEVEGTCKIDIPYGSSGGSHINGSGDIPIHRLDDYDLQDVDFIKIDCEGYELAVLQGAVETLKRCKPCVIVEQKQHIMATNFGTKGTPAVDFLIDLGAKQRQVLSGDHILTWTEK